MNFYYHVQVHLFITSGLKVSRGVQIRIHIQNRMCSDPLSLPEKGVKAPNRIIPLF